MPVITLQHPDGSQEHITIGTGKPLLMALEYVGYSGVPAGCRGGGCGACRIKVLSGSYESKKMSRTHVSEDEEKNGVVLACRTTPHSDLRIVLATPPTIVNQQQKTQATKKANPYI